MFTKDGYDVFFCLNALIFTGDVVPLAETLSR